ncbi:MAG: UDP-N-acetylmuramoyl-L-alanine--D-glutamate ligase [Clostridiales bacterium]|nr:UDP-N-acetylmuramoyl-L-alanine--D-glutamate ligase [Clostridiales bacterium]
MARSGIASARLLAQNGWHVIINDMKAEIPGLFEALRGLEYEVALGRDPVTLYDSVDLVVVSPIIPMTRDFLEIARQRGIEVISEIELGWRFGKGDFVCITGTNGKTTCTALTGEIFKASGRPTFVLGNIGTAISEHAMSTRKGDVIVAETAALQLNGNIHFHAKAAGVTNITPDHLDHFGTMDAYIAAKAKIFLNQVPDDVAVLNWDDPIVRGFASRTPAKVLYFSRRTEVESGMFLAGGALVCRMDGADWPLMRANEVRIPGAHNLENAMLCALLALSQKVSPDAVRFALNTFPGVEHRIEHVRTLEGVEYINDSKGTNPASTIRAIEAMDPPMVLILGGYDKKADFGELFAAMTGKVKACVVLGQTAEQILAAARACKGAPPCHRAPDFETAVRLARELAEPGDVALLSPACASWDMFEDFEQRGRVFKELVNSF